MAIRNHMLIGLGWAASMPKRHSDNKLILTGLNDHELPHEPWSRPFISKSLAPMQMAGGTDTDFTHLD